MEAGMNTNARANLKQLSALLRQGEGPALEFKRSTGELKEGMQTLCAFLNGTGGMALFGVRPDGKAEGQDVSDQTRRDIAQAADRFEPPAHVSIHRRSSRAAMSLPLQSRVGGTCGPSPMKATPTSA
jgi:predicted HTH transcriptional regulator